MKLLKIQERVADALKGIDALQGVPVVVEDKGDVKARLDAAVAQAKRCLLVQTPGLRVTSAASKVMVGIATVVVQAIEKLAVGRGDGAHHTAQDMAEIAAWELNLMPCDGVGTLVAKEISSEILGDSSLSYALRLEVQTTLGDPLDKGKEEAV